MPAIALCWNAKIQIKSIQGIPEKKGQIDQGNVKNITDLINIDKSADWMELRLI